MCAVCTQKDTQTIRETMQTQTHAPKHISRHIFCFLEYVCVLTKKEEGTRACVCVCVDLLEGKEIT